MDENVAVNQRVDLPVAIPVLHEDRPVRRRRLRDLIRRRRRRDRRRRWGLDRELEVEDEEEQMLEREFVFARADEEEEEAAAVTPAAEPSQYLQDLISEGLPCSSVLTGSEVKGCSGIVERCETHRDDVFYQCSRTGRTPLHEAALRCYCLHVVKAILAIDPFKALATDMLGNTPLHLLVFGLSTCHIEPSSLLRVVDLLLQPSPASVASKLNRDGSLPIHLACSIPESMVPLVILEQLLEASALTASSLNSRNQTPLHLHCKRRGASVEVAAVLLQAHPEALHALDESGNSPLHYAAVNRNYPLVRSLVESDPRAALVRNTATDRTPLHLLCVHSPDDPECLPTLRALLEAAPETVTRRDLQGSWTPLHLLCHGRPSTDQMQALLQTDPSVAKLPDRNQCLPLHHACEVGADSKVVSCLLAVYPGSASSLTRKMDTALSLACATNRDIETVQMLLQAYPDATLQANDYGFTPLHAVCRSHHPSLDIVQALVQANPNAVVLRTNTGESAIHLLSSNSSASIAVLETVRRAYESVAREENTTDEEEEDGVMKSKVGNTPLHYACFHNSSPKTLESLVTSNPEWVTVRNNAGYTPVQILCKSGRIDEHILTSFYRISGSKTFSHVDLMGNTPLHSAMRIETDAKALQALIDAFPEALHMTTIYDDTPLHLACLRRVKPDVVLRVAQASTGDIIKCDGRLSPLLLQNRAGQTPMGIAIEDYQRTLQGFSPTMCSIKVAPTTEQTRAFEVLAGFVKLLHYGPSSDKEDCHRGQKSLVHACVSLHRKGVRLDPAFVRRALHLYPEEASMSMEGGNYPLHIEASIPVEKMSLLLDATTTCSCCGGTCHKRAGVLQMLMEIYPGAARCANDSGDFPLNLMIQNGRAWDSTFALVVRSYPQALHQVRTVGPKLLPRILARISNGCGRDTLFSFLHSRPEILLER